MQKQLVYVGSTSEHKLKAVREALEELGVDAEVVGVKISSGVNEQPEGADEILLGATNRSDCALFAADGVVAIGIENGIAEKNIGSQKWHFDYATVVLNDHGLRFIADSAGHLVDKRDVAEARRRDFGKCTVGSVTCERTGCDATDATPYYTGGRMTRAELLKQAVKLALCQWLAAKEGAS